MNAQMITWMIILFVSIFLLIALWKVSKVLVIPIQILLFIILTVLVFKTFFSKDNIDKLNSEVRESGIDKITNDTVQKSIKTLNKTLSPEKSDDTTVKNKTENEESRIQGVTEKTTIPQTPPNVFGEQNTNEEDTPQNGSHKSPKIPKESVKSAPLEQRRENKEPASSTPTKEQKSKKMFDSDMFNMDTDSVFD